MSIDEASHPAHISSFHGETLTDPYAWLRAENWRHVMREPQLLAPDIRAWLGLSNDTEPQKG